MDHASRLGSTRPGRAMTLAGPRLRPGLLGVDRYRRPVAAHRAGRRRQDRVRAGRVRRLVVDRPGVTATQAANLVPDLGDIGHGSASPVGGYSSSGQETSTTIPRLTARGEWRRPPEAV